jgi:hypothetical protein
MNDRQRLEAIISVVCKYLPPDGIPINDAMSEIISYVDPLPPAQDPWVSLTPEQVQECADNSYYHSAWSSEVDLALFAQNLDAALRKANT